MSTPTVLGSVTLPCVAESVAEARRYGRKILEGFFGADDTRTDDAVLAISEAVTNSLMHSDSGFGGEVTLTLLDAGGGEARVEITDDGGPTVPTATAVGGTSTSGRGVAMIEALAKRTGQHVDGAGRMTYWFQV